jgi:toxin ParE1/3/4
MILRWTPTALRDLESLQAYIGEDSPRASADTAYRIVSGIEALERNPEMGRIGRVAGTRELIVAPYVVAYRVKSAAIELLGIIHSARRWPDAF